MRGTHFMPLVVNYSELIPNRSRLSPENALKPAIFGSGENRFPLNSL